MGEFKMTKIKGGGVDWQASKKANKTIRYKNEHTGGFRPKIIWNRKHHRSIFRHRWLWRFTFTRQMWGFINEEIEKDFTIMNKYSDATLHKS